MLRKDNTGYDLRHLFIGAEGTLGIITAASLKLFPAPQSFATAFVAVPDAASAVSLLGALRERCGDLVSSFELIPKVAIDLVVRHLPGSRTPLESNSPWYVLCEITSAMVNEPLTERLEAALSAALESALVTDAVIAQSERERQDFWFIREHIPEAQRRDGASLKHDVSLPLDRLAEFITRAGVWLTEHVPEGFLVCYGHVGDGNLHFNINQSTPASGTGALLARGQEIRRVIHDQVRELGGSFSAEHGIGRHKVEELERYAPPLELELMRTIKRALDPNGIMNPGKVLRRP
jgi:FAD/FMN-containing dehydrogenase